MLVLAGVNIAVLFALRGHVWLAMAAGAIGSCVLARIFAVRLARLIQNPETDELSPYLRTIGAQQKEIEHTSGELRQKTALLETVTNNMREGFCLTDRRETILLANAAARRFFGAKQMQDKKFFEICRTPMLTDALRSAARGTPCTLKLPLRGRILRCDASPWDEGVLLLLADVTDREKSEEHRRMFAANVSHELKTPLTTISGYSELMAAGMVPPDEIRDKAEKITTETARLLRLIEDIIHLSRLEEGEHPQTELDFAALCRDVGARFAPPPRGVVLTLPQTACFVKANAAMLDELATNLIENAIKYNKPGGKVDVALTQTDRTTTLTIADTGIGIAPADQVKIFERFFRADPSRNQAIPGTGLGLSICKHIAAAHKGKLTVESVLGGGTTMTFTFPRFVE